MGSLKEPDFEAVSSAAPDLIIVSGRTAGAYEELSKIAPTIDLSVDAAKPMESFKAQTEKLGKIFKKEDEAASKLAEVDKTVADTKTKAASAGKGLIVLTSGGEVTAYGAGSRFGIIHDVLGVPAAADVKSEALTARLFPLNTSRRPTRTSSTSSTATPRSAPLAPPLTRSWTTSS